MTDNTDNHIRESFEAESEALVSLDDGPMSEGFALKASPSSEPIFVFRYADYAHLVRNWNIPEHEKEERLKELWVTITKLATLGYGFHPIDDVLSRKSHAKLPCGQGEVEDENAPSESDDLVC